MFAETLSQLEAGKYLEHMEALAGELTHAMEAMVSMELPAFEMSVYRQRLICANLAALPHRIDQKMPESVDACLPADLELQMRLGEAAQTLYALNRRYSALLEHSGNTLKLFAGLFRPYAPGPPSPELAQRATWSCTI